jgi:hypothetical protein
MHQQHLGAELPYKLPALTQNGYKPCNKNWPQTITGFTNMGHSLTNMSDSTHPSQESDAI